MATRRAPWTTLHRFDARVSRSPDGAIVISMQRTTAGLFVERVIHRLPSARAVQAITFTTADAFMRWCQADPGRFEYPLFYARLERDAAELFADHDEAQRTG